MSDLDLYPDWGRAREIAIDYFGVLMDGAMLDQYTRYDDKRLYKFCNTLDATNIIFLTSDEPL